MVIYLFKTNIRPDLQTNFFTEFFKIQKNTEISKIKDLKNIIFMFMIKI